MFPIKLLPLIFLVAGVVAAQSAPPRSSVNPGARDYYVQLYDAGGFFHSITAVSSDGKPETHTVLDQNYVCFNDDATDTDFFTFVTMAYDERYAEADRALTEQPTSTEKRQEAWRVMDSIQQQVPYVEFMDDAFLGILPPGTQAYFRQGGRLLDTSFYRKGVKYGGVEYRWNEGAWFVQETPDPSAYIKTSKTFRLSIEPTTLRYIERVTITSTAGSGETMATESRTEDSNLGSGTCEKIPDKRSE